MCCWRAGGQPRDCSIVAIHLASLPARRPHHSTAQPACGFRPPGGLLAGSLQLRHLRLQRLRPVLRLTQGLLQLLDVLTAGLLQFLRGGRGAGVQGGEQVSQGPGADAVQVPGMQCCHESMLWYPVLASRQLSGNLATN